MDTNDIVTLWVGYVNSKHGKPRSALIVDNLGKKVKYYLITSKYENKSEYIKQQYFLSKTGRKQGFI